MKDAESAKESEDETLDVIFHSLGDKSVNLMLRPITRLETSPHFVFESFVVTFFQFGRAVSPGWGHRNVSLFRFLTEALRHGGGIDLAFMPLRVSVAL